MKVPADVEKNVLAWFGESGRRWLDGLPEVLQSLTREWDLQLGEPLDGGSHSFVAPTVHKGRDAVLKVPCVDEENRYEAEALGLYGGDGAVLLLAYDETSGAMVLERAVPGTPLQHEQDPVERVHIACSLLRRLRRPVPGQHRFTRVHVLVNEWLETLPRRFSEANQPFKYELIQRGCSFLGRYADSGPELLLNRDAHELNIISASREPWLLIDPKPVVGQPAFEGGHLLLDQLRRDQSSGHASWLAQEIGNGLQVNPDDVREWAFLRALDNALWSLSEGRDASPDLALVRAL